MEISIIIQARVGSTRLPSKIIQPFYGEETIADIIIQKLLKLPNVGVILAIPSTKENDILSDIADKYKINCFRGDENNVLKRFVDAATLVKAQYVVRVCSDNPFLNIESIQNMLNLLKRNGYKDDYISYKINDTPSIKTHYGFWAEVVSVRALSRVAEMTSDKLYTEHVTNFIYEHPEDFKITLTDASGTIDGYNDIRLTIDTEEDFENGRAVYARVYDKIKSPSIKDVLECVSCDAKIKEMMKVQIIKNTK